MDESREASADETDTTEVAHLPPEQWMDVAVDNVSRGTFFNSRGRRVCSRTRAPGHATSNERLCSKRVGERRRICGGRLIPSIPNRCPDCWRTRNISLYEMHRSPVDGVFPIYRHRNLCYCLCACASEEDDPEDADFSPGSSDDDDSNFGASTQGYGQNGDQETVPPLQPQSAPPTVLAQSLLHGTQMTRDYTAETRLHYRAATQALRPDELGQFESPSTTSSLLTSSNRLTRTDEEVTSLDRHIGRWELAALFHDGWTRTQIRRRFPETRWPHASCYLSPDMIHESPYDVCPICGRPYEDEVRDALEIGATLSGLINEFFVAPAARADAIRPIIHEIEETEIFIRRCAHCRRPQRRPQLGPPQNMDRCWCCCECPRTPSSTSMSCGQPSTSSSSQRSTAIDSTTEGSMLFQSEVDRFDIEEID